MKCPPSIGMPEHYHAFNTFNEAVTSTPTLALSDFSKTCDQEWCLRGQDWVQFSCKGDDYAFTSKRISKKIMGPSIYNYGTIYIQEGNIGDSSRVLKMAALLDGQHFKIHIDHKCLKYLIHDQRLIFLCNRRGCQWCWIWLWNWIQAGNRKFSSRLFVTEKLKGQFLAASYLLPK